MNAVLTYPALPSAEVVSILKPQCALHTDCSDVHSAFASQKDPGFVLLHTMGTEATFSKRHIPNAVFLPHRLITAERMQEWPMQTLFVTYCAGPHCNAAEQAALRLAQLGRPVKLMLGGLMGWEFEGFAFAGHRADQADAIAENCGC
ncbi:rhodanese [Thioclava sp. SK-1]|uniref:rhodanese-like domain-containing protein n=1 Tax=Thioclava sp. SK-1 TaxID=1889770 RepID=UPI0008256CB4|nr:rhodanese-like domain-containing protein [Thioclava sp. SK-1]OCX60914.1 rhodanese [Thioclava sp. SK-1]